MSVRSKSMRVRSLKSVCARTRAQLRGNTADELKKLDVNLSFCEIAQMKDRLLPLKTSAAGQSIRVNPIQSKVG